MEKINEVIAEIDRIIKWVDEDRPIYKHIYPDGTEWFVTAKGFVGGDKTKRDTRLIFNVAMPFLDAVVGELFRLREKLKAIQ